MLFAVHKTESPKEHGAKNRDDVVLVGRCSQARLKDIIESFWTKRSNGNHGLLLYLFVDQLDDQLDEPFANLHVLFGAHEYR